MSSAAQRAEKRLRMEAREAARDHELEKHAAAIRYLTLDGFEGNMTKLRDALIFVLDRLDPTRNI